MATKKTEMNTENVVADDGISVVVPAKKEEKKVTTVRIMLPLQPETNSGLKLDPYEHVTINGNAPIMIKRGEWVDVPVPVFLQLRNRYPNI